MYQRRFAIVDGRVGLAGAGLGAMLTSAPAVVGGERRATGGRYCRTLRRSSQNGRAETPVLRCRSAAAGIVAHALPPSHRVRPLRRAPLVVTYRRPGPWARFSQREGPWCVDRTARLGTPATDRAKVREH